MGSCRYTPPDVYLWYNKLTAYYLGKIQGCQEKGVKTLF